MATSAPKAPPKAAPTAAATEEVAAPKKSKKKLFLILAIVLLILGGGGGFAAWHFMGAQEESDASADADADADPEAKAAKKTTKKAAKQEPAKAPVFVNLEQFTVNLQSEGTDQFLQISMTLQVADPLQVELFKLYMPQVRSRLLLLLSSKKPSEISTAEGKKKLTDEIIAQLKLPFTPQGAPQGVSNVFFTSFVIQ